jgi:hypothetical protein
MTNDDSLVAGSGVYFGPGCNFNSAFRTPGNQAILNAELSAILRALQVFPLDSNISIISDNLEVIRILNLLFKNKPLTKHKYCSLISRINGELNLRCIKGSLTKAAIYTVINMRK